MDLHVTWKLNCLISVVWYIPVGNLKYTCKDINYMYKDLQKNVLRRANRWSWNTQKSVTNSFRHSKKDETFVYSQFCLPINEKIQ